MTKNNFPFFFLVNNPDDVKLRKYMWLRRGGKAIHKLGDLSRETYPVELVCISDENESNWIGNFAEGYGFFGVEFAKEDCRDASDEEIAAWIADKNSVAFEQAIA